MASLREMIMQATENAQATQRIVTKSELAGALAAGARVVTKVDEDSFVVEGGKVLVVPEA